VAFDAGVAVVACDAGVPGMNSRCG
jgi:hypothetical protein